MNAYNKLTKQIEKIYRLNHAVSLLAWDDAVMMPTNSGKARSESISCLSGMAHDLLSSSITSELISSAKNEIKELTDWQQRNLELIEQKYINATCFDNQFVEAFSQATMSCEQAWRNMRSNNDWQSFKPLLTEVVNLTRERAQRLGELKSISSYDALVDEFSPGINQAIINPIFSKLKVVLPGMVEQALMKQKELVPFAGKFAIAKQQNMAKELMKLLGFDFTKGRLDISHHPFCGGVQEDVRITTRYQEHEFLSAMMGVCHETGHALYEFGLPNKYRGQLVGESYGMTIHESQSLFLEMQICRSKPFMELLQKQLTENFEMQDAFKLNNLYNHHTHVAKGLIRVDADELTYPLHIIMRYELEQKLISSQCEVEHLPELWHEQMQELFGLSTLNNYKDGVMQDVHWPSGAFGYFPAYTLGAITAAQLGTTMRTELPTIDTHLDNDSFQEIRRWLGKNVHQYGSRFELNELMSKATGKELAVDDYLAHLKQRYI